MVNVVDLVYEEFMIANPDRRRSHRHYPSGLCAIIDGNFHGKCRRATYWSWIRTPKTNPIDPPAFFKMNVGDKIHELIDERLTSALIRNGWEIQEIEDEKSIVWDVDGLNFPLSGRIDKWLVIDDTKWIGEWKSTFGRGVASIRDEGPKVEAVLQVLAYLNSPLEPDGAMLVYVGRDNGLMFGMYVTKQDEETLIVETMGSGNKIEYKLGMFNIVEAIRPLEQKLQQVLPLVADLDEIQDRLDLFDKMKKEGGEPELKHDQEVKDLIAKHEEVQALIDSHEPPERDYQAYVNEKLEQLMGKSDWQCKYCGYRNQCWEGCKK